MAFHVIFLAATVNSLNSKKAREHWEKEFNAHYIQPVLGKLDDKLNAALDVIARDDKQSKISCCNVGSFFDVFILY